MNDGIKIGYACTPISIPCKTSRSFILKNFSEEKFNECVSSNLEDLLNILKWNVKHNIYMFRISSDIIPFGSHEINDIAWWNTFSNKLRECGDFIKSNGIRVSMHPGQYTVLNSPDESVVKRAIDDLIYHCKVLDSLEVDCSNKIVLHVGGVYGDKPSAVSRFISNFEKLPREVKSRLILENDDKSYNIKEVLYICNALGIPAVFDNLHHKFNPCPIEVKDILQRVASTWKSKDGRMKLHYSDSDDEKKKGAHSKTVDTKSFLEYMKLVKNYAADVMLEVKDKEVSAIKCINALDERIKVSEKTSEWARYKYLLMEKDYSAYKACSAMVNSDIPMREIYEFIDECLKRPFDEGNFKNAAEHVYGYVKDKTSFKEKDLFFELIKDTGSNRDKIKELLKKLCKKYDAEYINNSYYFIY